MIKPALIASAALAACHAPAGAAPGGQIGTLQLGNYVCELPGDAAGPAGVRQSEADFAITFGSSYRTPQGPGTYLATGDRVVFTSGPLRHATFHRTGRTLMRRVLPDGSDGPLRCVRQGSTD